MTCAQAKSGFREILIEMNDEKAFIIPVDSYLLDTIAPNEQGVNTTYCSIMIQRNNIVGHENEYLLGGTFLYHYY